MAKSSVSTQEKNTELEKAGRPVKNKRRYVGSKETLAYVLYDISASFNISKYDDLYITNIVVIGFKFQSIVTAVIGVWDIINDLFVAAIIDKTRTRFGKFRPWLAVAAGPGLLLAVTYWILPLLFKDMGAYNPTKLTFYMIFRLLNDLNSTITDVAKAGALSTITPNVNERTKIITQACLFSGFVEKGPEIIFGFLMDEIKEGDINIPMESLFVYSGVITAVLAGLMGIFFVLTVKERIMQKVEKPSIIENIKSLFNNKLLLVLTVTEFLSAFSINSGMNYYYDNVLNLNKASTIVGIPGAVVSPVSYSYVTKAREKFSTKTLWIVSSHLGDVLMLFVYFVGSVNQNYKNVYVMIPTLMIRETIWMSVYGLKSVIGEELRNETMDYGEWKNGYRTEGMTGVTKNIPKKLMNTLGTTLKSIILDRIGYVQGASKQTPKVEFALFKMCTLLPTVTSVFCLISKFFYNISNDEREQMYRELAERRQAVNEQMKSIDTAKE